MKKQNRYHEDNKGQGGFTLVEIAIVLIILAIIITPLFAFLSQQQQIDRQREEEAINERVLAALALYFRQNGVYPCPASPMFAPGDADFGRAAPSSTCSGVSGITTTAGVSIGAIPVRDLNLPFQNSANTRGWKYIYAVTTNLTNVDNFGDGSGAIIVNDVAGVQFIEQPAQFIIVNTGSDGKGTYSLDGALSADVCNSGLDQENCNNDEVFIEAEFSINGGAFNPNYYDDTIAYTLAREESTFWLATENTTTPGGGLNIVNRNVGNVGIGTNTPIDKLHVSGGSLRVQAEGTVGGNIQVDQNITATGSISATNDVVSRQEVRSPVFFYE